MINNKKYHQKKKYNYSNSSNGKNCTLLVHFSLLLVLLTSIVRYSISFMRMD